MKFEFSVDEDAVTRVFWTGASKSGCAGQYSDCFLETKSHNIDYQKTILASETGGSCVGVAITEGNFVAKTMPCRAKVFLACQGKTIRSAEQIYLTDVILRGIKY